MLNQLGSKAQTSGGQHSGTARRGQAGDRDQEVAGGPLAGTGHENRTTNAVAAADARKNRPAPQW